MVQISNWNGIITLSSYFPKTFFLGGKTLTYLFGSAKKNFLNLVKIYLIVVTQKLKELKFTGQKLTICIEI